MFDQRVEAIEFRVDNESKVTSKPLMELSLKKNLLVCFIKRQGKIIIPTGQDCIKPGDTVMIVTTHAGFTDISDILE
jgi:trk system potassium uptake protein TrkA